MSEEEQRLMRKAWSGAGKFDAEHNIGAYETDEHEYPAELERAGFRGVNVDMLTTSDYAPDNASVSHDAAIERINCRRTHSLASVQKALSISPDALSLNEYRELTALINKRYDERTELYRARVHLWDFSTTSVLVVSEKK